MVHGVLILAAVLVSIMTILWGRQVINTRSFMLLLTGMIVLIYFFLDSLQEAPQL